MKKKRPVPAANLAGAAIRRLRKARRVPISQEDLAAKLVAHGVPMDRIAIGRIESGTRKISDIELVMVARVLRCSVFDLVGR